MAELARTIREWLGATSALPQRNRQQAARDQLHGHINDALLEPFLRRTISPEQHAIVVGHLNLCDACREAIALVLLAQDDPSAAAELELKRKQLAQDREPWQRVAVRWTVIVMACIIIVAVLLLLPETYDPNSRVGTWINSQTESLSSATNDSDTSFGALITTKLTREKSGGSDRNQGSSWLNTGDSGGARKESSGGWLGGSGSQSGKSEASRARMEIPLPQKRESASPGDAGDGGGPWFFGADDRPESTATPVWDPVRDAKRRPELASAPDPARRSTAKRRLVVSPEGTLRRTLDGGATWDVLDVGQKVRFNALALSGTTVWAAGAQGALYRSPDAAEHWQSVTVRHRGVPLTADIKHIRFNDPQHGAFETSHGQVWITVDGGNKWVLSSTGNGQ